MNTEDDKDPIEITIDDTEQKAADTDVVVVKAEDAPAAKAEDPVVDPLLKLKEQLAAEQAARVAAENRANSLAETAHKSRAEAQDANIHLIASAITAVESQNDILKAQYREAVANSDADAMADLQMEMAENAVKLSRLQEGKQALEAAPKEEAPRPVVSDAVEALASQLTPRSAAWVRAHPEYATDANKYQKMLAAHNLAIADGLAPDSDAYFESVEDTLRINRAAPVRTLDDDPMSAAATTTSRRQAPPAAPVSRAGGAPGTTPNRVTLTADEREIAEMMGMTPQEYGKHKLSLIKEGRLH